MTRTLYTGYGGGGGSGGAFINEATIVNYDDGMTIDVDVDGGARGNGDNDSDRAGFAGSAGKVFLVSRFSFSYLIDVCMSNIVISLTLTCSLHLHTFSVD